MIRIEGIGELQRRVKPAVERVDAFDWQGIGRDLDQQGNAMMEQLLSPEECRASPVFTPMTTSFAVALSWGGMASGVASTNISAIRFPIF